MKRSLLMFLVLICVLVIGSVIPNIKNIQALENLPSLTNSETSTSCKIIVKGNGEYLVKPDTAKIKFAINTLGENIEELEKENLDKTNNIITKLEELNINKEDIKNISFSMYKKYDYSNGSQVLLGTEISNILELKTNNLENLSNIISILTENNVSEIFTVNMSIEDYNSAYNNALLNALENARKKAQVLAGEKTIVECKILEDCINCSEINMANLYAKGLNKTDNLNQIFQNEIKINANVIVEFCVK